MGNCVSGKKEKNEKGDSASADNKPNEDVTYASISHTTSKETPKPKAIADNDCDYATVNIPARVQPEPESDNSDKEECADDYVLME